MSNPTVQYKDRYNVIFFLFTLNSLVCFSLPDESCECSSDNTHTAKRQLSVITGGKERTGSGREIHRKKHILADLCVVFSWLLFADDWLLHN